MKRRRKSSRYRSRLQFVALPALLFALVAALWAANPAYLNEMPSVDRILAEVKGSDEMDSLARQCGAMEQMEYLIEVMAGPRRFRRPGYTADESRLKKLYDDASFACTKKVESSGRFDPGETKRLGKGSPAVLWYNKRMQYGMDAAFREELLKQFFSPAWRAAFQSAIRDPRNDVLKLTPTAQLPGTGGTRGGGAGVGRLMPFGLPIPMQGLLVFALLAVPFVIDGFLEMLPIGLDATNPMILRSTGRKFELDSITGVSSAMSRTTSTTKWTSTDRQGIQTYSYSTTVIDSFSIWQPDGKSHAATLVDARKTPSIVQGQVVSAVWVKKKKNVAEYVLIRVHSTGEVYPLRKKIAELVAPRWWPTLSFVGYWWAADYVVPPFRSPFYYLVLFGMIAYWIVRWIVKKWRVSRFVRGEIPLLVRILDERATGIRAR